MVWDRSRTIQNDSQDLEKLLLVGLNEAYDEETSDLRRLFPWSETECHRSQSLQVTFRQRKKSLTCRIVCMD